MTATSAFSRAFIGFICLAAIATSAQISFASTGTISTVAGTGVAGEPRPIGDLVHDGALYISDEARNQVVKYALSDGVVTVVAGNGSLGTGGDGGLATAAQLDNPFQLAFDAEGNLYIADAWCDRIRRVDTAGIITTIAGTGTSCGFKYSGSFAGDGGPATSAQLHQPQGVAVDAVGNVFIADTYNHRIRKVDAATGTITSIAGVGPTGYCCVGGFSGDGGPATEAQVYQPSHLLFDGTGNLFFTDSYNERIRRIDGETGIITTIAGNGSCSFSGDGGPATSASICGSLGLTFDGSGDLLFADNTNGRVRKIDAVTGSITTVAGGGAATGDGGPANESSLSSPCDVTFDAAGNLYIAEADAHRIRRVDPFGIITTINLPPMTLDDLHSPADVAADSAGNRFIADTGNHRVIKLDPSGSITRLAGTGIAGYAGDGGMATSARLNSPAGLTVDGAGNVYIADTGNNVVRKVNTAGIISTVAGTGSAGYSGDGSPATAGRLNGPRGLAWDGFNLYIADTGNHAIRRVDRYGVLSTFAGTGIQGFSGDRGQARMARLNTPNDVTVQTVGSNVVLYIADSGNNRIRKVDQLRFITTFAGKGSSGFSGDGKPATSALLASPRSVWVNAAGTVWVADTLNYRIRKIDGAAAIITTVAGTGQPGFSGDGGPALAAMIAAVQGIALDTPGNLYLADWGNHRIRKVDA
jgi:sugar lactone lactonase YvrE